MRRLNDWLLPLLAAVLGVLPACQTLDEATADLTPYGVQLRERIDQWDRWCRGQKLGPYNDGSRNKADGSCDFLFLKDTRWDPNADEFSRYAHSIQLPPPHDKPQAHYRTGMSSATYLKELCAREAGEWIFRTASNVDGVLQARTVVPYPRGSEQLTPFAREPVVSGTADDLQWLAMGTKNAFSYEYFEYPEKGSDGAIFVLRYYRSEARLREREPEREMRWRQYFNNFRVPYVVDSRSRATYAYVGRGTVRSDFEQHGIRGFELLVIDTRTKEVLALRRTFVSTRPAALSLGRLHKDTVGDFCRLNPPNPGAADFVVRVAQPPQLNKEQQ